ncbi:uncharacterized protein LOC126985707 [Eriocheir sinensis]|uniref:uncharacterized protein LOC126985707 n=1 Tax=Eriocheir sinensis TaxID=95602 RepID=UPI0021C7772C|nr:uncharacterized protein LOC126985707 [Eriocheir sinensis]XP_050696833.1 uncharacterized protein LOC126985707 [Eriocheir sinensis]XP_050696834.1 uncharacterized protein LOC126985707 [Eriocheir sinensis]XP_050696835.1 uncharacterized protein LOC126985707 [Eriocheir sinensis]
MSAVVHTKGAVKCEPVLKTPEFVDIVCAERLYQQFEDKMHNGSGVYRITWHKGLDVTFRRPLPTLAVRDMQVWQFRHHILIAFLNAIEPKSHYGGYGTTQGGMVTSHLYRHKHAMVEGKLFTSYNNLEKGSFATGHARGLASLVIGTKSFIAVANYRDRNGNTETYSEIFVYEHENTRLFQRIRTSAARSWAAFTFKSEMKQEHFLVVANEFTVDAAGMKNYQTDSMIYKYHRGKFVPFQCVQTVAARQWVAYQGPKGDFLLAMVSSQVGVSFYQYNGWRFIQMPFNIRKPGIKSAWMGFLPSQNRGVLTLTTRDSSRPLMFYLQFEVFQPAMQEAEDLRWCHMYRGRLGRDPREVLARVQRAPRRDQPFTFPRPLRITGSLVLAPSSAFSTIGLITVREEGYTVDHSFSRLSTNIQEVRVAFSRVVRVRTVVAAALKVDGLNLDGFRFESLKFQCGGGSGGSSCLIHNLVTNQINGQSVSLDGLLWLHRDLQLQNLSLAHADLGAGVSASVTFLSGPNLPRTHTSDLLTLTGDHAISGHKEFGVIRVNNLFVSGTINNIRVDEHTLLLADREQTITADFTFTSLSAQNLRLQLLNGRDFSSFLQQLVLNNTDSAITGHLIVRGDVVARNIHTTRPARPLDPRELAMRALLHSTHSTQVVTGVHTLGALSVGGELTVTGTLNGLSVPRDVYLRSRNETVTRPVTFHSVRAASVQVLNKLGDVKVLNGQLDLLLLRGDQQVSGRKVFTDMVLLGHSTVSLTVSGYRLQDLENTVLEDLQQGFEAGQVIIGEVTFEGQVRVTDVVLGGANITHILLNALPLQTTSISSTFIFEGPVKILGDTRITTHLNEKRVELFALLAGTHIFTRSVSFTSDVVVEGNVLVATTVNGINLQELTLVLALKDSGSLTITQDITLHSPSFVGGLQLLSGGVVVDGIDLEDIVLADTDAVITGTKTFTSVRVESSVSVGHVAVAQGGQVDGVVLEDLFFGNSLRKTGTSTQHLVGRSLAVVVASSVTGTGLGAFERTVVYKDSASERLAGSLVFTGPVTIQDLSFGGSFDGVSADEYKSGWLLATGDQVLTGSNIIQNLDVQELVFTGRMLQGVDFERLVKNTAKIDETTALHSVAFNQLVANGEVFVNGTVQGIKLSQEAITLSSSSVTITGRKVFQAGVHYRGQFSIAQHIIVTSGPDDTRPLAIDIEEFCTAIMTVPSAATRIRKWIIKGDARFEKNVTVVQTFNGELVSAITSTFWFTDVPTTISAVAFISSLVAGGSFSVDVRGKTNGQSLEEVWKQILKRRCEAQTVGGQLTVHQMTLDRLSTPRLTNPNDDLRVGDFLNILLQDGDQVISGVLNFTSVEAQDIGLEGTLNGLRMHSDFVLYGRQNVITARKTFAHLTILGNLSMVEGGTVQGVDVSELGRLVVKKADEGQVVFVPGVTVLRSLVYTGSHFQVNGRVDGVFLRPDTVLLRSGEQVMTGMLEVVPPSPGAVGVEAGAVWVLDNKFNDVDLDRLVNRTVRTDRQVTIHHSVSFSATCRFTSIAISSQLINGIHIQELANLINADYLIRLGDHLGAALHAARSTREVLAVKGASIWYYEELAFDTVAKLIPVTLGNTKLEVGVYDALVGLDMANNAVLTYGIGVPFPKIYPAVTVLEPIAVAGLGSGLLATCGRQPMEAVPAGTQPLPKFTTTRLESGTGTGYGHIYALGSGGRLLAAFETRECRDLVSFQLPDGRVCVAVVNYRAATTVLCGTASTGFHLLDRLDATRAIKGVWVTFAGTEVLMVAQEPSHTEAGILDIYGYNAALQKMTLIMKTSEPVSSHVTAMVAGGKVVVAMTGKRTALCDTFVEVFMSNTSFVGQDVQRLEVPDAVHSHLIQLLTGEVVLMVQTRHSLYHYHLRGTKFVYVREVKTSSSLCPWSFPFIAGDPKTLLIAHSGMGAYQDDYKGAQLLPVPTTIYRAVYRGPSFMQLYRGSSHSHAALHGTHQSYTPSPPLHYHR